MGTISISHSWNCRIFILFSTTIMCLVFTTFLIRYNGDPSKKNHQRVIVVQVQVQVQSLIISNLKKYFIKENKTCKKYVKNIHIL